MRQAQSRSVLPAYSLFLSFRRMKKEGVIRLITGNTLASAAAADKAAAGMDVVCPSTFVTIVAVGLARTT
jgi:hypothetical protein